MAELITKKFTIVKVLGSADISLAGVGVLNGNAAKIYGPSVTTGASRQSFTPGVGGTLQVLKPGFGYEVVSTSTTPNWIFPGVEVLYGGDTAPGPGGSYGYAERAFSQVLTFDIHEQYMETTQVGPLAFTKAGSGHVTNSTARVAINPNGAPITAPDFKLDGDFAAAPTEVLILDFAYFAPPLPSVVSVSRWPRVGAAPNPPTQSQLAQPINVQAAPTSPTFANLAWSATAGATSYAARRATNAAMTENVTTVTVTSTSAIFSGLTPNTAYYYDVQAKASGYVSSVPSVVVTATQPQQTAGSGQTAGLQSYKFMDAGQVLTPANQAEIIAALQGSFTIMANVRVLNETALLVPISLGTYDASPLRSVDMIIQKDQTNGVQRITAQLQITDSAGTYLLGRTAADAIGLGGKFVAISYDDSNFKEGIKAYLNNELSVETINTQTYFPDAPAFTGQFAPNTSVRYGQVVSAISHDACLDDFYIVNKVLSTAEMGEIYPTKQPQLSFINNVVAYYRFENNTADETGKHNATASAPIYVNNLGA